MAETKVDKLYDVFDDFGYKSRKALTHIVGKGGLKEGSKALAVAMGAEKAMGIGIAVPLTAVFSAALEQYDHIRRRRGFLEQYRPEIAKWLAQQTGIEKKPEELTTDDLDLAAYGDKKRGIAGNPGLQESVVQSAKERTTDVIVSGLAAALSTLVVGHFMQDTIKSLAGEAIIPEMLIGGAIGFGLYLPITAGIHWVAEHLFGLEKETLNDHLQSMERKRERGKSIEQSEVLEAFVKARPELDKAIEEQFGVKFAKLGSYQQQALSILGPQLGIPQITDEINRGAMRLEELSFIVHGQASGNFTGELPDIAPPEHRHSSMMGRAVSKITGMFSPKNRSHAPEYHAAMLQTPDGSGQFAIESYHDEQPEKKHSFVQMVGRKQDGDGRNFAQMVGRREVLQTNGSYSELIEKSQNAEVQLG